jgi:hypothetical protein
MVADNQRGRPQGKQLIAVLHRGKSVQGQKRTSRNVRSNVRPPPESGHCPMQL